ncbi:MAG: DNA polymerase [Candidatus Neomarinimicrobiota bacterium]
MFEREEIMWNCPSDFPNLNGYKRVAIDLETKDPDLKSKGSGALRGNGNIIGIALAVDEGPGTEWQGYYPIAHEAGPNLDKKMVLKYVKSICENESITKIFHNAMYDVSWLRAAGIEIKGPIVDTMVMLALIDENRFWFSLNSASWDYLKVKKDETLLTEEADRRGYDPKSEMYLLEPEFVGPYAEKDAELTIKLYNKLETEIEKQNLHKVLKLETELFPCLIDMKFKGVRVDSEKAYILEKELISEQEALVQEVQNKTKQELEIWAAASIAKVFDHLNISYPRTAKSKAPSFTKQFLTETAKTEPLIANIARARELSKMASTFVHGILNHVHRGRIHADINPIRSDTGGTVTGRFSYANPNLQQIPIRNPQLGSKIRGLFLPERDHLWGSFDYSQQEPRMVVHYAATNKTVTEVAPEVHEIADQFKKGEVDFHQIVADMAGIDRKQAKTINLGLFYGMGKAKLQNELKLESDEAHNLFEQYHERVPFVKALMQDTMADADEDGEIVTIGGRHCRFNRWQKNEYVKGKLPTLGSRAEIEKLWKEDYFKEYPKAKEDAKKLAAIEKDLASDKPYRIKRAMTYKALNRLIQGSSADMTKQAIVDLYKEGFVPHIQIHDELDISVVDSEKDGKIIKEIMENVKPGGITMAVPNKVDDEYGQTWGDIKG